MGFESRQFLFTKCRLHEGNNQLDRVFLSSSIPHERTKNRENLFSSNPKPTTAR